MSTVTLPVVALPVLRIAGYDSQEDGDKDYISVRPQYIFLFAGNDYKQDVSVHSNVEWEVMQ